MANMDDEDDDKDNDHKTINTENIERNPIYRQLCLTFEEISESI